MLRSIKISLLTLILSVSLVVSVRANCPVGDLSGDCQVNLQDLQVFAERWLDPPGSSADFNRDDKVNVVDFALLAEQWYHKGIPLVINELMASNSSFIQDPQYEYDDWLEIYNAGDEAIDVGGMYLTDDLGQPTMWRIPNDNPSATTIPAHDYLLIWADNDTSDPGLHANFKLSAGGEEIGLFAADGDTLIDSILFVDQTADISFGRYPDANNNWRYFGFPSPGGKNMGGYLGEVADPKFSHDRGFYEAPFSVTITTDTKGTGIYYTLDGSAPYITARGFPMGTVYSRPIPITKTTCLRAMAFKSGWKPTAVDTHTYIFLDDVLVQPNNPQGFSTKYQCQMDPAVVGDGPVYDSEGLPFDVKDALLAIPTMSIVMDRDDLFGPTGFYSNPGEHGDAWERPASVEFIDPDGGPQFQINCGVRMHGGWSRDPDFLKHSMRLYFRDIYGPTWLRFPLFPDTQVDSFDKIVLRAGADNSWISPRGDYYRCITQYQRDQFARDIQRDMGDPTPHGIFVHLYINGVYWGLYNPIERPDAWFAADYIGGYPEQYDVLHDGDVLDGDKQAWNTMMGIASGGLSSPEAYQQIQQYLDVKNLINYTILNCYIGNVDWPHHNWYAARKREPGAGFKFFSWDAEEIMYNRTGDDRTGVSNSDTPAYPYYKLWNNAHFRLLFADHLHRYFFNGGVLTPEKVDARWMARAAQIDRAIVGESARWGDTRREPPYTRDAEWLDEQNRLRFEYFTISGNPNRSEIVLDQFRARNLYPDVDAPTFKQHGGHISPGDLFSMTATGGTIWYCLDGNDPRLPGTTGQQGTSTTLVAENAAKRVLVPAGPISDNWKGGQPFDDSAWALCTGSPGGVGYERSSGYEGLISLDVEAQMYNGNTTCYIRIPFTFDADPAEFNFMALKIRYDDGFIAYLNGVEIARRNFSGAPAWNSSADGNHEAGAAESFYVSDHISVLSQGSNILAIHGLNVSTTSSDFIIFAELVAGKGSSSSSGVSPTAMQYTGPIALTQSANVKARVLDGSTWSALNEATFAVSPVVNNLRITEIMYYPQDTNDPNDPNEEFIELKNIGPETLNLNLVSFTNGIDFVFPSLELAAGDYVLVVKDINAFQAQYGTGLNLAGQYTGRLNNAGERIRLQDAIGQTILDFRYRDGWRPITDGNGFSLTIIDPTNSEPNSWGEKDSWRASAYLGGSPGWDDSGIVPERGAVVINELLAHSHLSPDWIELHNTTGELVDIGGWFLSDSDKNLTKYEIATGTTIGPYGYIVFYEDRHFGNNNAPGCHKAFALGENGEEVYLSSSLDQNGDLTGYREVEDFGASETDVAFGRYYKSSTDNFNFVAMSQNTPGSANAYPKVGPIVINEIMYHPDWPKGGSYNNDAYEYIELHNISAEAVTLYHDDKDDSWKFTDGIDFTFPEDPVVTIPAGGYVLVVKDPNAFSWRYPSVPAEKVLGPYDGRLRNSGERVELGMPSDVDRSGTRCYIRVDRVNYSDGSHPENCAGGVDLWPMEADGGGFSLTRKVPGDYGNDVSNWEAALPSPGLPNP